jgi:hypothetical protein
MYKKLHENSANAKDIPDFQERIIPEIGLELYVRILYPTTSLLTIGNQTASSRLLRNLKRYLCNQRAIHCEVH